MAPRIAPRPPVTKIGNIPAQVDAILKHYIPDDASRAACISRLADSFPVLNTTPRASE